MYNTEKQAGFALLISLLVVGVVISVGLSILDLSIKQVRLASNATESEKAFHAANAGIECARYWRRVLSMQIEDGMTLSPSPTCFGQSKPDGNNVTLDRIPDSNILGDGFAFRYQYEFTWGTGADVKCSRVNMIALVPLFVGTGMIVTGIDDFLPGYPSSPNANKTCLAGGRCNVIAVQGFNVACARTGDYGVVQREILVEF
jgi:type II secretory pathway pseudopilin PulG